MAGSKKTATRATGRPRRPKASNPCDGLKPYHIKIARCAEVGQYIAHNGELGPALAEICAEVRRAFGPKAELALELYRDPEVDDQYLTLYVRQVEYATDIMDRIEAVLNQFMRRLEKCSGHLLITTDFRRPGG